MDIVTDGPTLKLAGDLDGRSTWKVRAAVHELLATREGDLVVDLSLVNNADVVALKVLAAATRQAARDGRHLTLRGCGPAVRRLLHLSRLARVVEVDRAAATA